MRLVVDYGVCLYEVYVVYYFAEKLWKRKNSRKLVYAVMCICSLLLLAMSRYYVNTLLLPLMLVGCITAIFSMYDGKAVWKGMCALILIVIFVGSEIAICLFLEGILGISVKHIQQNTSLNFIATLLSKLLTFLLVRVICLLVPGPSLFIRNWRLLGTVLSPLAAMSCILLMANLDAANRKPLLSVAQSLVTLVVIMVDLFTVGLIGGQIKLELHNRDLEFLNRQLGTQIKYAKEISTSYEQVKKLRHDFKNQLIALSGYMDKGHYSEAMQYMNKLTNQVAVGEKCLDVDYVALEAVLKSKLAYAENMGCKINHSLVSKGSLKMDEMELSILIANLLDNAIEAAAKSEGDRAIEFQMLIDESMIHILSENPIGDKAKIPQKGVAPFTTKEDQVNHGWGLLSIKEIVDRQQGRMEWDGDIPGKFRSRILLMNKMYNWEDRYDDLVCENRDGLAFEAKSNL